ncbi:glutathione S-transferase [Moraxella macacae 0408225]|uniref:glutathione transferase n=1 Tax=Moraxella macacae 0408225 TaxID=1230338 RepID=L2F608_9GAMM|nr:glutathione S-transferase [Moraxella macacae]ELA08467.1 glutathione S-transferase [Moraxella macacae 0408225]
MSNLHLHHLKNSRSFRIIWLLEELSIPYQLTSYDRENTLAPKSLKSIHPMGKSPILTDGDKTLIESAHIIEYLIDNYDLAIGNNPELLANLVINKQFRPDYGTVAYENYRYWLHFTESSLMPLLMIRLLFGKMMKQSPIGIKQVAKLLSKSVEQSYLHKTLNAELLMLDKHLGQHDWLAGEQFTGADIQLEFAIDAMQKTWQLEPCFANIHNWLKRCHARPAYQQAVAKGGENQF